MSISKKSTFAFVMHWHIDEKGGGAEVQARFLAIELYKRGYKVDYICQTENKKKINTSENIDGVKVHWLKKAAKFAWVSQNKYYSSLKSIKPDFIIQRNSSNLSYPISKYCATNIKKHANFVWICTDNLGPFKNFHVKELKSRLSKKKISPIKKIVFGINALIMDYYRINGLKKINIAFTQNEFQKMALYKEFNLKSYNMISGHPTVKSPCKAETKFKNNLIIWCSNLGSHKRPEIFIELAKKMVDSPYKFYLIGGHSDNKYVEKLLNNKPSNMTYFGKLNFNETTQYFKKSSLFISTTDTGGEGFPNTFIQSWRQGTPIISFGADPNDVIKVNKLGHVSDNVESAALLIKKYLSDFNYYADFYDRVINYNLKNHTTKFMTDNFLKILSKNVDSIKL